MRMEEVASGIDRQETKLDKALEEIIEKEKAATDARSLQDDNKKIDKAAAEEHRNGAVERLGEPRKRNAEKQDGKSPDGEERKKIDVGSGVISERKVRKRECAQKGGFGVETKGDESNLKEDMMKMLAKQQQQQTQVMLCLLAKGQNKNS